MPIIKHTIEVDVEPGQEKAIMALLDKYRFTGEGVKTIDQKMTKPDLFITPHIKKMVRKK